MAGLGRHAETARLILAATPSVEARTKPARDGEILDPSALEGSGRRGSEPLVEGGRKADAMDDVRAGLRI